MIQQPRTVLAALLAPLLPCLFAALFVALRTGDARTILIITLRYAVVAYAAAFVFGLPAYYLLARGVRMSALRVSLLGAVFGALSGALLQYAVSAGLVSADTARTLFSGLYPPALEYAMFGAMTALGFWWLARIATPKRVIESQDQQEINKR